MNNAEKRLFLINYLISEEKKYADIKIPSEEGRQRELLRALMNVREAKPVSEEFLRVQDEYLRELSAQRGRITDVEELTPVEADIYLWQGDITTLKCDAIVNAANSGMTGCYHPLHNCIDNAIHTYAGVQLRLDCAKIMEKQGYLEPTGQAKITSAYNLPCKYVIHTVGPVAEGNLTKTHEDLLASCYKSSLELAEETGLRSIAFCCISTGVFGFPQREAAQIAVQTVKAYKKSKSSGIKVIFNVFKEEDYRIYRKLLG